MNLDWLNDVGQILPSLVGLAAKATAAMTLATVAVLLMRRAPAGARHCVLAAALTLVLLMPLLSTVLPSLNVRTRWRPLAKVDVQTAVQPQSDTAQATVISPAIPAASEGNTRIAVIPRFGRKPVDDAVAIPPPAPTRPSPLRLNWRTWLAWLWIAGVAVALAPLIASRVALAGLARRCTETEEARLTSLLRTLSARLKLNRRVRLLVHTDVSMPMTWGVLRPVILLPRASLRWPDDRRRIVLLHELAHVKWLDCLWLLVAKLARAVHWFNPLAWWCVARLRTEAERACDERVLNAGESAPEYAEQLLRTVASLGRGSASDVLVLGMARRSTLETRLRSILDRPPVARVLTPRRAAALVAMLALLLVPMSMLHLAAQTQPSPQKVLVRIVSTQGLPRASAYVSDKLTMQNATTTDADGRCQITAETSSTWFAYWPGMTSCAVFRIPKSPGHQPLTIKLDSSVGICYQRVTDGQGHGARGVGVTARVTLPDGASIETPRQFTDAAGYCEFALIPMVQGISIQSAVMTSGNTSNQWSQPTRLSSHRREIYLPDLAKQDIASPAEKPAWVGIGGTVRGQDGNSVADADVEIIFKTPPELGIRHRQAVTDPSGRWTTLIPHDAEVTHLQISHPRFVIESGSIGSWGPSPDQLRAGMAVTVLHHGVPLDGIVRDENGSPVPDVLIITRLEMSVGMSGPTQDPSMGRTGSDGKFRIESMDAGPHRLSTFSNDYLTSTADINLQPGTKPVEFKISKGGSVTGVVLDQQGKSVAGARVSASATTPRSSGGAPQPRRNAVTDATGHFRLDVLPRDKPFNLVASTTLGASGEFRAAIVQDTPYLITIAPRTRGGGGNMITVLDDATGAPVTRYRLFDGPQFTEGGPAQFSQGLRFTVGSKDGTYIRRAGYNQPLLGLAVRVIADGYLPAESPIVPGGESKPFVLRLKAGKPISGAVVDSLGNAVGGAQVAWVSPDRQAFIDANGKISDFYLASPEVVVITESDGHFLVPPGMPPGTLVAVHANGYTKVASKDFHDGETLHLSPWAKVEGHLKRGKDTPANVRIGMYPLNPQLRTKDSPVRWMLSTATRPDGSFAFDHLPAVPMAVGISELRGLSARVLLDPKPNQTVKVQIGGVGREVTGVLQFPKELGIDRVPAEVRPGQPRISIVLRPASDPDDDPNPVLDEVDPRRLFYSASVSDGQHFTIHDVRAGQYVLFVKILAPPPQNPRGRFVAIGQATMPVAVAEGDGTIDAGEMRIKAVPRPADK